MCLILLVTAALAWAETPPPAPRNMCIYMKDGTVNVILCSRIDPEVGINFLDNGMKMKLGLTDLVDPIQQIYEKSTLWFVTCLIDSITFPLVNPPEPTPAPTPEPAPAAGLNKRASAANPTAVRAAFKKDRIATK
jgi:hypothetical protein